MEDKADEMWALRAASFIALDIPAELLPGVAANLALLRQHASRVMEKALADDEEPAAVFRP